MAKIIFSVEFSIPGHGDIYHRFNSDQSLLDADIVLFRPDISCFLSHTETFQGLPSLSEDSSFRLKHASDRWRDDLRNFVNEGKTVFVLLNEHQRVFVKTGEKSYSGTGRSARVTNIVAEFNNLQCIPLTLPPVIAKTGSTIIFKGNPIFSSFWHDFEENLEYRCYFEKPIGDVLFTTKTGAKPIGALIRAKSGGCVVLLPDIYYDEKEFTVTNKDGEEEWNKSAMAFGNRLTQALVEIDRAIRSETEQSPPPDWASSGEFMLNAEVRLATDIKQMDSEIAELQEKKEGLQKQLRDAGLLRALVYEKGKRLETAVIEALRILGFSAEGYEDGELQLDQVIISPEGVRYIGECEGRDGAAINIEKFRQLATNLQEDLEREDVNTPARAILFGNAFRIVPPEKRAEYFTTKCINNAVRSRTALIATPDLFHVAKLVAETNNLEFAKKCREAISSNPGGRVVFPSV